jgi:hypothetical protein
MSNSLAAAGPVAPLTRPEDSARPGGLRNVRLQRNESAFGQARAQSARRESAAGQ